MRLLGDLDRRPTMTPGSEMTSFEFSGNTLHVRGDLGSDQAHRLEEALGKLLEVDYPWLVVDLSGVNSISNVCACHVAAAMLAGQRKERLIRVRAREGLLYMLYWCGIDRMGKIEITDGG